MGTTSDERTTRRRGAELEAAIADAVLGIVREGGARAVTMEAVAARAGTSKPVLYRRWPDRGALLRHVLLAEATRAIPTADTGSFRGDLLAVLRGWAALLTGPRAPVVAAVVAAMVEDPQFAAAFRDGVIGWRKAEMAALIRRGIDRGEVRPDVPVEIARELGQSVLWHRFLVTGDPITDDVVRQVVDEVVVPFAAVRAG
ncbi:TetR/AcrR family transcriptional regulator [Modestobacter versicolor]|uniref:TetR/AcrR family transcriptional regulator n=1 Tax=Modestobacter versicolor TaxID=429133 RepID=UPI0034E03A8C